MSQTSSRLLELLSLLQARRDWRGEELADRLEVSGRTVRRDIERLRQLGYPVESLTGRAGGYRLSAGSAMPPLLLDDEEAIAIAVGLRTAARAPQSRSPLVSRRVGSRPRRLADLPAGPPRQTGVDRGALYAAQAAGEGCGRIRGAEHHRSAEPIRGRAHAPRLRG